jgi:hypothetical protein
VTVLESISQCEGEEEWQMIAKSVVTLNTWLALCHAALGHAALVKPSFTFMGLIFVCSSCTTFYLWIPINCMIKVPTHTLFLRHISKPGSGSASPIFCSDEFINENPFCVANPQHVL